ncbi:hypothetical protein J7443_21555 [Tropicibacter sp. R15_0]|uniref:hypothetical protein n=1 Tax=Tropicibacter sp. R15_0 TaxID=2821101 RepID=UPI001ADC9E68|nr:hypothetical protein [Tropicibacter sp. R15_0]MBO9467831.1 hypothetical protein [Tropicibacter sp. R15_0]
MLRNLAALGASLFLLACNAPPADLAKPAEPMGAFKLGHAEVVAPNLQKLLVSRDASAEEWSAAVDKALEERFRRFDGDQYYHIGVSVEAYSLPPPVVPGKSALAVRVTVFDDATQAKLNEKTKEIHAIHVFESRLQMTREDQIARLSESVALEIEKWMRQMHEEKGWFAPRKVAEGVAADEPGESPAE